MSDRGATIQFCGEEHELILTTKATKEITRRYGGLDKLGEEFFNSKSMVLTNLTVSFSVPIPHPITIEFIFKF